MSLDLTPRAGWSLVFGVIVGCASVQLDPWTDCEGYYPHHLQGVAIDHEGSIFWSFTTELVKTDWNGHVLQKISVPSHYGDLTCKDGQVYVAVNFGEFNHAEGKANSWVYVHDGNDLSLLQKLPVPEVTHGAGGIAHDGQRFIVVGGLPAGVEENYLYEYDMEWTFIQRHTIATGHTEMGIQTATFSDSGDGGWVFGCYGTPRQALFSNPDFTKTERANFDCAYGIVFWAGSAYRALDHNVPGKGHTARLEHLPMGEALGVPKTAAAVQ